MGEKEITLAYLINCRPSLENPIVSKMMEIIEMFHTRMTAKRTWSTKKNDFM